MLSYYSNMGSSIPRASHKYNHTVLKTWTNKSALAENLSRHVRTRDLMKNSWWWVTCCICTSDHRQLINDLLRRLPVHRDCNCSRQRSTMLLVPRPTVMMRPLKIDLYGRDIKDSKSAKVSPWTKYQKTVGLTENTRSMLISCWL